MKLILFAFLHNIIIACKHACSSGAKFSQLARDSGDSEKFSFLGGISFEILIWITQSHSHVSHSSLLHNIDVLLSDI